MGCMEGQWFWIGERERDFSLALEVHRLHNLQFISLLQVSVSAHKEGSLHILASPSFAIKKIPPAERSSPGQGRDCEYVSSP